MNINNTGIQEQTSFKDRKKSKAYRALEALAVVVVIEGFYPSVTSLNRETTAHTFSRE